MYLDESRGKCKNLPGLVMALLKRRTRPKKETPLPERELLPERRVPSPEELRAHNEKQAAAKLDARERLADGRPVIWPHPAHPTQEERQDARREAAKGRRKIDNILSTERNSPRGRKADSAYDRAAYQVRVARVGGKKVSVADLTRQHLSTDKSVEEDKLDKMKQAIKRRR
jgi:hypothetical protein